MFREIRTRERITERFDSRDLGGFDPDKRLNYEETEEEKERKRRFIEACNKATTLKELDELTSRFNRGEF